MRLNRGIWRYASIWDLRDIVVGVAISSVIFWIATHLVLGIEVYPRSVMIIDAVLLVLLLGGLRLARRIYDTTSRTPAGVRVLIYGAGDAGELIAKDMLVRPGPRGTPVGFLDDDPSKRGLKIHDVPVYDADSELDRAITELHPDEILIAIPSAEPKTLRRIVNKMSRHALPIKTVGGLREISNKEPSIADIRELSVADLLARLPIGLDTSDVRRLIQGECVLVTGAGGSIGSELCRQIADCNPARLILIERYENSLFAINSELSAKRGTCAIIPIIADITDERRMEDVFKQERPAIVFHAAAHKHVPLMEANPTESVKNNVRGTRLIAELSLRYGADRFVMISTDKAVNPTSVMGATKRIAERVIQRYSRSGETQFVCVRFGNVLASNGSVVPTFLAQIRSGGPVTVTHPEMRRFFMLIPEAVQLVLQAAALGGHGSLYVLDMGEQIRVLDMARSLIRLAGYVPEEDIEISFTGIRPGEKLFEELVATGESTQPSGVDKVLKVEWASETSPQFKMLLDSLESAASDNDSERVRALLVMMEPTMQATSAVEASPQSSY